VRVMPSVHQQLIQQSDDHSTPPHHRMRSRRKQLFPDVDSLEEVVNKLRDELQTPQQPRVSGA